MASESRNNDRVKIAAIVFGLLIIASILFFLLRNNRSDIENATSEQDSVSNSVGQDDDSQSGDTQPQDSTSNTNTEENQPQDSAASDNGGGRKPEEILIEELNQMEQNLTH